MTEKLEEILSLKHVNPTAMRLLVLDYLVKQTSAVSLSDIEREMYNSDRVTLYRTLKTFEEKGIVHSIEDGSGASKYALCSEECDENHHHDTHVHFFCSKCKETICLPKSHIPAIALPPSYLAEEMNLTVKGLCEHCNINAR